MFGGAGRRVCANATVEDARNWRRDQNGLRIDIEFASVYRGAAGLSEMRRLLVNLDRALRRR